jgi:tape measure domain-containing protein
MAFTVDIRGNASHLEKTLKSVKTNLNDLATTGLKGVTAGIAAFGAAGAAAIGAFVVTSSRAAASLEDLAIQFEVLTGSAQASKDLLKAFREEEQKSALNTEDYANAAKTFLAFGGSLEDTLPSLKMLADVSMGNSERFGSLALAFAQTTAAGRLMGQEVLQFVNAGFNPLEQIARDTGKSMAELKKEMEDGKISVSMVRQAFINATSEGGRFFGAIDKGSATTSAKLNQTRASVTRLQVAFGTGFNEGLKDALDATNNFLPQLEGKFTEAGTIVGTAITQSIEGNSQQLALLGTYMGEVIMAGMSASILIGFDQIKNIAKNSVEVIGSNLSFIKSRITGDEYVHSPMSQSPSMTPRIQSALEQAAQSQTLQQLRKNSAIGQDIIDINEFLKTTKEGTKEGVKEGMKEVWYSLETGAKFQN